MEKPGSDLVINQPSTLSSPKLALNFFIFVRDSNDFFLLPVSSHNLQADRQTVLSSPAGQHQCGVTGEVEHSRKAREIAAR